ncbi:MAG: hypothetical protein ACYC7L_02940 [Nitrospirota bacterium]
MCRSLTIYAAAALLLLLFAAGAAGYGPPEALAYDSPPVAQPLVREGDFAVRLAALYGLGAPANETEAQDLLAGAGIVPLNGWIADYPVTPEILGQLQESAARSASEGALPMSADTATRLLSGLVSEMNLPLPAEAAPEQQAPVRPYEQTVVSNYYAGYGPPIITYYPPPLSYLYLYAWVPYPAWWYGSWYPGFYIFHDFSTTIAVGAKRAFVRNRFVDPVTRQVVRVDPVARSAGDGVRPLTTLRTNDGRAFRNIREMRQGMGTDRPPRDRDGTISRRPPSAPAGRGGVRIDEKRTGPAGYSGMPQRNDRPHYNRTPGEKRQPVAPPAGRIVMSPPGPGKQHYEDRGGVRPAAPGPSSEQRPYVRPPQGGQWMNRFPEQSQRPLGGGAFSHGGPRSLPGAGWGGDRSGQRR